MEGSVYLKARQEWDERYADLVLGKRNWQITAAGMMACRIEAREVAAQDLVNVEAIPFDSLTNALPDIIKSYATALVLFSAVAQVGRWRRLNAAPTRLAV